MHYCLQRQDLRSALSAISRLLREIRERRQGKNSPGAIEFGKDPSSLVPAYAAGNQGSSLDGNRDVHLQRPCPE
jgi:hypothetical protein